MTEQQTPDREKKIAEIREALEKVTPGPWKWVDVYKKNDFEKYNMGGFVNEEGKLICHFGNRIDYYPTEGEPPDYYDELLIANAPEWLRFLLSELERKDEVIEEQKRQLFYKSQEITELQEKSWQDQQWFKQASANITEMQKELDRIEREHAEERAAHNAHVTELEQERDKLIEGLRWYGDEIKYMNWPSELWINQGQRARDILLEIGVTVE